jgi:hypothetical protein
MLHKIFYFGFQLVAGVRGTQNTAVSASSSVTPFATKVVGWWLLGCGGMVFGAVVLGNLQVC